MQKEQSRRVNAGLELFPFLVGRQSGRICKSCRTTNRKLSLNYLLLIFLYAPHSPQDEVDN